MSTRYVIDPDDHNEVQRLLDALDSRAHPGCHSGTCRLDQTQAALRDLTEQPLPPEPLEPRQRVEDREGDSWARHLSGAWVCEHGGVPRNWEYLVRHCGPLVVIG